MRQSPARVALIAPAQPSHFVNELADALRARGAHVAYAPLRAALADRDARLVIVDRMLRAASLSARHKARLTLVLTGARQVRPLARRLQGARLICLDWSTYTQAREAGLDAACFLYAPPAMTKARPSFVARANGRRLDEAFLAAMTMGSACEIPGASLFHGQYVTHGVNALVAGKAPLNLAPTARGEMAARNMAALRRDFLGDRARLADYALGLPVEQRTPARIDWPPACPPTGAPAPADAFAGGARLTQGAQKRAPQVTVAIVMWNVREAFEKTLASVLAQRDVDREIVVIDGGSTDGSLDVLRARDSQLDYWRSEKDKGPYDAMNKAAAAATGEFLIYMNAGDYFPSAHALADALAAPAAQNADFIIGHHIYVDANGVESLHKAVDFEETWAAISTGALSFDWMAGVPCGQAVLIRTQILKERPFDLSFRIAADHNLLYAARQNGARFWHCGGVIGVYTAGGLSGANDAKTARELLRLAQIYGPADKARAWFAEKLPIALDKPVA